MLPKLDCNNHSAFYLESNFELQSESGTIDDPYRIKSKC